MTSHDGRTANRLIHEKSPYLLQHAWNPVDWFPWGPEALEKARREDRPILISIGYATCHWCHVMERESFEDPKLAAFLNEHFVPIKVDREERPDVDKIYMDALHAMGESGGWPLNMFLTQEAIPFTGGTYFPPQPRYGRPSFRQVLERIHKLWREGRDKIQSSAAAIVEYVRRSEDQPADPDLKLDNSPLDSLVTFARKTFDTLEGGFQTQPQNKFPPSMQLMALLRSHRRLSDEYLVTMVERTLTAMKRGGIYDQIGGGLSRYSTDYKWLVPHFEKMLYDNALWIQVLTEAYQGLGQSRFRDWAWDAIAYIRRDMTSPEGAFYSAEDADSEGEEGKFYVWSEGELNSIAGQHDEQDAALARARWGVTARGNFEGHNILFEARSIEELSKDFKLEPAVVEARLARVRAALLEHRAQRPRPLLDDKILTSWNGLMISAFARAAWAFADEPLLAEAERAAETILEKLRDQDGRLLRRYREGEARYKAYLVDYGSLANACLDLFTASSKLRWFKTAREVLLDAESLFARPDGAWFDTGSDAELLIARTSEGYDGVEPSGNSTIAWACARIYALTGEDAWRSRSETIVRAFWTNLQRSPWGYAWMLRSLEQALEGPRTLVFLRPSQETSDSQEMLASLRRCLSDTELLIVPVEELQDWIAELPILKGKDPQDGAATAFFCAGMTCSLPATDPATLRRLLEE